MEKDNLITKKQKTYVWSLWRKIGLNTEHLYDVIQLNFKTDSMTSLTCYQGSRLIDILKNWKEKPGAAADYDSPIIPVLPHGQYRMTSKQRYEIERRLAEMGWTYQKLKDWMIKKKIVKYWDGNLHDLYPDEARFVISGLEKIRQWEEKKNVKKAEIIPLNAFINAR